MKGLKVLDVTREVDLETFATATADGFVVDVREPREYTAGHVPGARLVPLAQVLTRIDELPRDQTVYVICASGNRSKTAVDWMRSRGIEARSVTGGTTGWTRSGRPLETGPGGRTS